MADIEKSFPMLMNVIKGKTKPRFKKNKKTLENKIKDAFEMLENCQLCERTCNVNRTEKIGYCKVGDKISVSGHYIGRNQDLSIFNPSYDVFFLGCVLNCVFCHNPKTSQAIEPRLNLTEKQIAKIIDSRKSNKIVDFVGGDPIPHIPFVLKILDNIQKDVPVMWNSSFYMTTQAMELLRGVIDVYSPDFKYGNDQCAKRLSKVKNYTEIIKRNIEMAVEDSEVVIRHLVLPNHIECCSIPVIDMISDNYGDSVLVHLSDQYNPTWKAKKYDDINRCLRKKEFKEVVDYATKKYLNFVDDY
jgi:putative pyruvate formate lyase activating enzyme